jgi:hypothetical protein
MCRHLSGAVLLIASLIVGQSPAAARGAGFASENPLAAEHIEGLPLDIRRSLVRLERKCGTSIAGHYFSVSIKASGRSFVALHFEKFYCPGSLKTICGAAGCLHEVFLETGGRHVRVFAAHAEEITMTNAGGVAGLEMLHGATRILFQWNGRGFGRSSNNRLGAQHQ